LQIFIENYQVCFRDEREEVKLHIEERKDEKLIFQGFCDSDYAGDQDSRKSVTGYAIYLLGYMVVWKSKSQRSVALSCSEAEYISILEITKDILFVKQVLDSLGQEIDFPIHIMVDNIGAIYMAENNMSNN
jgi:hypothetical protein